MSTGVLKYWLVRGHDTHAADVYRMCSGIGGEVHALIVQCETLLALVSEALKLHASSKLRGQVLADQLVVFRNDLCRSYIFNEEVRTLNARGHKLNLV